MPLYDFRCEKCPHDFEEMAASGGPAPVCPKCGSADQVKRQVSGFRVGGRGDQRESTQHGCHDATPSTGGGGHKHGSGCGH
jgi:putative FmdB family regulatory protein